MSKKFSNFVGLLALLAVVALVLFPAIAFAQGAPQLPCAFHGTVLVNGQNVADGTVITATIWNDMYTTVTTTTSAGASTYSIVIFQPEGADYAGKTVTFTVDNLTADQTAMWQSGYNIALNITVGVPQSAYIVVHAHNPEGVEIASIQGMDPYCVQIYDGDSPIGYGAYNAETHGKPIKILAGAHTIKVKFNGITLEQNVNLNPNETQSLIFTFERTSVNILSYFDFNESNSITQETYVSGYGWVYASSDSPVYIGSITRPNTWVYTAILRQEIQATETITPSFLTVVASATSSLISEYEGIGIDLLRLRAGTAVYKTISIPSQNFNEWWIQNHITTVSEVKCSLGSDVGWFCLIDDWGETGYITYTALATYEYTNIYFCPNRFPVIDEEISGSSKTLTVSGSETLYIGANELKMSSVPYDLAGTGVKDENQPPVPPVASFTYSPQNPVVGEQITFDASSSYDTDGQIVSYNWDFGDGNTAEGQVVNHACTGPGDYSVSVSVIDNDGLSNSESKIITVATGNQPPVASFTYSAENCPSCTPMVGGSILFDASSSSDPDGTITNYGWDFGDGSSDAGATVQHIFTSPQQFTVTLTVTDNDGLTASASTDIDLSLGNGDLLLCRSSGSLVPFNFWTHVGMYDKSSNTVIEALPEGGVQHRPLSDWFFPSKTCVRAIHVETNQATANAAVAFASAQVGCRYDWLSILINRKDSTNSDGLGWYCTELVWASYLWASNGLVDLDMDAFAVGPDEIASSSWCHTIGEHQESIPNTVYTGGGILWGEALCPVDLVITDPGGLVLNKQASNIPGAVYRELDIDGDGQLDDAFMIPEPKIGVYAISVIPELGASPGDTYSLEIRLGETIVELCRNVPISNIPSQGYVVRSTETGIEQIVPATTDFDPNTVNLKSKGQFTTAYIELPTGYNVGQIDVSTVRLNGVLSALSKPTQVGDYDKDGVPDLMMKFDRASVQAILTAGEHVKITISGQVNGILFEGSDTIKVIGK